MELRACWWVFLTLQGRATWNFPSGSYAEYYCDTLRCLRKNICCKWLKLWQMGNWTLKHYNLPAQSVWKSKSFLCATKQSSFPTPLTLRIWPPVDTLCSQNEVWSLGCGRRIKFQMHEEISNVHLPHCHKNACSTRAVLIKQCYFE